MGKSSVLTRKAGRASFIQRARPHTSWGKKAAIVPATENTGTASMLLSVQG